MSPPEPPNPPSSTPPPPLSPAPGSATPPKRHRWLLYGCGSLLAFVLLVVATVAITIWWIQRPIKPVVLSPPEKAKVEAKLQRLEAPEPPRNPTTPLEPNRNQPVELPPVVVPPGQEQDRRYQPGAKEIRLTEREINGLLNANTDLGRSVRIEFARDAVNAYLAVRIPQDFPIGGGKMFRARGRFRVSIGNGGQPYAVLEDVTVFGISLPKAWLGGLKGENLLADAMRQGNRPAVLRGIKSLHVEPGALVIDLED